MKSLLATGVQFIVVACASLVHAQPEKDLLTSVREDFRSPPPDTRPTITWWWFNSSPSREVISKELDQIKDAGFGGVIVQRESSASPVDASKAPNSPQRFLEAVQVASLKAKQLGLSFDVQFEAPFPQPSTPNAESFKSYVSLVTKHLEPGSCRAFSVLPILGPQLDQGFSDLFKKRRGYDASQDGTSPPSGAATNDDLPHDIAWTIAERWRDELYTPVENLSEQRQTDALLALPTSLPFLLPAKTGRVNLLSSAETWNTPSLLRMTAALAHRGGAKPISALAWNELGKGAYAAGPLDLKVSADIQFLAGANHIVAKGWGGGELPPPAWSQGDASILGPTTPWYPILPELSRYLQRLSYLLRSGKPNTDILVYLPLHDAFAEWREGALDLAPALARRMGTSLLPTLLRDGYSVDFVDDDTLAAPIEGAGNALAAQVLIIPNVERFPRASMDGLARYLANGGKVLFQTRWPLRSPSAQGKRASSDDLTSEVKELCQRHRGRCLGPDKNDGDLSKLLRKVAQVQPDVKATPFTADLGFVHRKVDTLDVYFIANTANVPYVGSIAVRGKLRRAEWWDPMTGKTEAATFSSGRSNGKGYSVSLPAYGTSVLVVLPSHASPATSKAPKTAKPESRQTLDLTNDWEVSALGIQARKTLEWPVSWTEFADMRAFSGEAVYRKQVEIPAPLLAQGGVTLSLGEETPTRVDGNQSRKHQAWIESPVREAAIVLVNGRRVGSVWAPPYEVEIGHELREGANDLEIRVYNVAANQLASRALSPATTPDAGPVPHARSIQALPSGLLGPIHLRAHQ